MIVCPECGVTLASRNGRVKYVVCSFCMFEGADLDSRREILFPRKEV